MSTNINPGEAHMPKYMHISLLFAALELAAGGAVAAAQGTAAGKVLNACTLLSAPEIKRIAGRPDLATGQPRSYQASTAIYSNCILSGAVDVGITVSRNAN